jgi:AraC-like DNA-binding protein
VSGAVQYHEYPAELELRPFVQCIWTMEGQAGALSAELQPVLPDGRPELVVHLADPFERIDANGACRRQPPILFAGQLTRQLILRPTARVAVVGVRFRPHGASALWRVPQAELTGTTGSVDDIDPRLNRALGEVSSETEAPATAVALIARLLTRRLRGVRLDSRVSHVVDAIDRSRGLASIERLSREAGMTRRHLERRFRETVGVSPKRLARITRFQRAVTVLEREEPGQRGARTALECGYADQAHFIREFRDLAGCSPGAHLVTRGELTGFFTGAAGPDPRE